MIPDVSIDEELTLSEASEQSKSYKITDCRIQGYVDNLDALQQAVYKMLNTEKYEYPIYSFSYGIELEDLIGQDRLYVQMELMRRIKECLLSDDRIDNVENFEFSFLEDSILCTFDVVSIYGTTNLKKEVNV